MFRETMPMLIQLDLNLTRRSAAPPSRIPRRVPRNQACPAVPREGGVLPEKFRLRQFRKVLDARRRPTRSSRTWVDFKIGFPLYLLLLDFLATPGGD